VSFPFNGWRGVRPEGRTLPELLLRRAASDPGRRLVLAPGVSRTAEETVAAAGSTAAALHARGVMRGDRVAVIGPNSLGLLDLLLGCAWLGAALVPLNPDLTGAQLAAMVDRADVRAVVVDGAPSPVHGTPPARWALDEVLADDVGYRAPEGIRPEEPLTVLHTSGTTGVPKGVCCPHSQFFWWGILTAELLDVTAEDVLWTCLPMSHTNALNTFFQALVTGATFAIGPRFSVRRFWAGADAVRATVIYLLGAMVPMLQSAPPSGVDLGHRVRVALAPGSPGGQAARFEERFGVRLVEAYGSTETNCIIGAPVDAQRPGWMGTVREGFDASVLSLEGAVVPDGQPGELVVRSRIPGSFASGYLGPPPGGVLTPAQAWVRTGDRVIRDDGGWYRFVDRVSDVIRRRGENISATEVERAILEHPGVSAVAVYPLPSELAEDEVAAAVVVVAGASVDPVTLIEHCRTRVAYFAVPRFFRFVGSLPLTANGKVRRSELVTEGRAEGIWDRDHHGIEVRRSS
jgi:crotonobetaine/carnitine-CoA ligase